MNAKYPFTEADLKSAAETWGCNCGPSSLAFAMQLPLDAARFAIPGFEAKRYTSPTMMKAALEFLGATIDTVRSPSREDMFADVMALVRIQFTGPWTAPGANPRWAYGYTHWIACWKEGPAIEGGVPLVFDCNGGACHVQEWENEIVPLLATHPRGDGGWSVTHVWRVVRRLGGGAGGGSPGIGGGQSP